MHSATVLDYNGDRVPGTTVVMTFPEGNRGWAKCTVNHEAGNPGKFCTELLIAAILSPQRCFPSTPQSCGRTHRRGTLITWRGVANFSLRYGFQLLKVGYGNTYVTDKEGIVLYMLPTKEEAHSWFDPYADSNYAYGCCDAQGAPTLATYAVAHGPPTEGVQGDRLWRHRNCTYHTDMGTVPCIFRSKQYKYAGKSNAAFKCKRDKRKTPILEWQLIPIENEQELEAYPGF